MKELLQNFARRYGLDIGPRRSRRTSDGFLELLFEKYAINVVIDVGANIGQVAERLRRFGFKGRIVSFEPIAATYAALCKKLSQDAHWMGFNVALGEETKEVEMTYSPEFSYMASLYSSRATVPDRFSNWSSAARKSETVQMDTLDRVFEECVSNISEPIVFLKCDTQGHDLSVLHGGREALKGICAVQIETSVVSLYDGTQTIAESIKALEELGFAPCAFYPVTTVERGSISVIEFDCVAVKSEDD